MVDCGTSIQRSTMQAVKKIAKLNKNKDLYVSVREEKGYLHTFVYRKKCMEGDIYM